MLGGQAELLEEGRGGAGVAELVIDADPAHRGGTLLTEQGGDRLPQAADDRVLLAGDDLSALLRSLQDQLLVQGLDGAQVDDSGGDAGLGQRLARLDGLVDQQAVGDDGHVAAIPEDLAPADLEPEAGLVVEHGDGQPAEAQVDRALVLIGGFHCGPGLHIVGGGHDHHAGDGAHEGEVLAALVGGSVLPHRDAAVGGADLHVQVGVANGVAHLLEGPSGGEHGKAGGKGHQSHGGRAGGHGNHIPLGDATVEVPVRKGFFKGASLGGASQVGVEDNQVVVELAQLLQRRAVAVPGGDLFHFRHLTSPPLPPAGPAAQPWQSHIPRRWGPCRASPPGPPCS